MPDSDSLEDLSFAFIGENIRELRRRRKWTQAELGQRLRRRTLSRQAISWIESGKNTDLGTIADIAATLGVDVGTLTRARHDGAQLRAREPVEASKSSSPSVPSAQPRKADLVEDLLAAPQPLWENIVAGDPRYHSSSAVRALLDQARVVYLENPGRSRELSAATVHLTERMSRTSSISPELRVEAWRELAFMSTVVGQHDAALSCLETADGLAEGCTNAARERAVIEFVRAIVLSECERFVEAQQHLLAARAELRSVDHRRYVRTFYHEALLKSRAGDPRAAVETIERVLGEVSSWGDQSELSALYSIAAQASRRAGEPKVALEYLKKSAAINAEIRGASRIVKDRWLHANAVADMGEFDAALAELREVRVKLIALGLREDTINLDLDYLRTKIAAGAPPAELHALCSTVAAEASKAGLPVTTCDAIDWLRRISNRLSLEAVDAVQSFIEDPSRIPLSFPPPESDPN